nr:MAG TPA: zinc-ribbon domain protein [Caudoviricetes sp.]
MPHLWADIYEPPCSSRVDGKTKICPDCGTREAL